MTPATETLIRTALDCGALKLGQFTLKSGRASPYFFNFGALNTGAALDAVAEAYADALAPHAFDVLFGPAYKGIPLAAATAVALARRGRSVGYAYNRKEAKDHGEGGHLVGAPVTGNIALLDDLVTAGTALGQAIDLIRDAGGTPTIAIVAMNRQEAGPDGRAPLDRLAADHGMTVTALFTATDVAELIDADHPDQAAAIRAHLAEHGVNR